MANESVFSLTCPFRVYSGGIYGLVPMTSGADTCVSVTSVGAMRTRGCRTNWGGTLWKRLPARALARGGVRGLAGSDVGGGVRNMAGDVGLG